MTGDTKPHSIAPRLVSTAVAREYLGGRHPLAFNVQPIGTGRGQRWDLKAIDHALDKLAGIAPPPQVCRAQVDEDEGSEELERLARRIDAAAQQNRVKAARRQR